MENMKNNNTYSEWTYMGKPFIGEDHDYENLEGFVYMVTDKENNNKKYIGKKRFWRIEVKPPLKGRKLKRRTKKPSDWEKYHGSSEEVKKLVEEFGGGRFEREILILCRTKGEMNYLEMKEQVDRNVLLSDDYYNEFIGGKIHSAHLKLLKEEFNK